MRRNEFFSDVLRNMQEGQPATYKIPVSELSKNPKACNQNLCEAVCAFENEIGGEFVLKSCNHNRAVIWGLQCPFGEYAYGKPHLCSLTTSFFEEVTKTCCPNAKIKLIQSIAGGESKCIISVSFN